MPFCCLFYFLLFQWQSLNTPFSAVMVKSSIRSCVVGQFLYITANLLDDRCDMHRTKDLVTWESVATPYSAHVCHGLVSCDTQGNRLYGLWTTTMPTDQDHLILYRFKNAGWKRMPNGKSPTKQWDPAAFCLNNGLVLAGGWDGRNSLETVQEYSLIDHTWLAAKWASLPKAVNSTSSVVTSRAVHLFGGFSTVDGELNKNHEALTIRLDKNRPIGEWESDFISYSAAAGAQNVFEFSVICGCTSDFGLKNVFLINFEEGEKLSLPHLSQARKFPSVVHFQNSLIVFGGITVSGPCCTAEILPAILPGL